MDFHALVAKMQQLDRPSETTAVEGCGDPMPSMAPPMPPPDTPPPPPPSMNVSLNAQGLDNIESLMNLFRKVNPDMMPKMPEPMPGLSSTPTITSITPIPLKSTDIEKDFDADNDDKIGGEMDFEIDKKEAWENEPDEEEKDVDYMVNKLAGGMNGNHKTFPKVAAADNPMQKISVGEQTLKDQIKQDLQRRLAEAKGAK